MQASLRKTGIVVLLCLAPALGDYTFPAFDVTAGFEPALVALDTSAVPAGDYSGYSVTLTWLVNTNGSFSQEAAWELSVAGDRFPLAAPGASDDGENNAQTVTLNWSGDLTHTYHGGDPLIFRAMQTLRDTSAPWSNVSLTLISGVVPPTPAPAAYDLGDVTDGWKAAFVPLDTNGVAWFKFTTPDVTTTGCETLRVDTIGSSLTGGAYQSGDDSELAVFNAAGLLVGTADDVDMLGGALHAEASFGVNEGAAGSWLGELAGGEYYVAVAGFDALFDISTFGVTSVSDVQGVVRLHVTYGDPAFDCNGNGSADACDIASGVSFDVNTNGVPDECDDCNHNGILDSVEVAAGSAADCNRNAIPDECDALVSDCNFNGQVDACEIAARRVPDCNRNGMPDSCDLLNGASADCNANNIPDECEFVSTTLYRLQWVYVDSGSGTVGMEASRTGPANLLWHSYLRDPVDANASVLLADAMGLAIEPNSGGRVFALVDFAAGQQYSGRQLVEVMPAFIVSPIRVVGPVTEAIEDIVFSADGTLYGIVGDQGATPGEVVTIDVDTGAVGHVGIFLGSSSTTPGPHALAMRLGSDLLYHTYAEGGQSSGVVLESFDLHTNTRREGPTIGGISGFTALVYDENREVLLGQSSNGVLWEIDPVTGSTLEVEASNPRHDGLAFAYGALDCNSNSVPDACDVEGGAFSDFDGDRLLDVCDADIDNDGFANAEDACNDSPLGMGVNWHGGPFGDWDDNCEVNLLDYVNSGQCLGTTHPGEIVFDNERCQGVFDADGDQDVDLQDFAAFQALFESQP